MAQNNEYKKLPLKDLLAILWRSFFIQTGWNFKSMISIGFCFALMPIAKKICANPEELNDFFKRHVGFFNSHPYFASYAIGAVTRLEEERKQTHVPSEEVIDKFKNALIGPLGAIGDQCCWFVMRPASLIVGLTGVAFSQTMQAKILFLLLTFILYNIPHIYIRVKGVLDGYGYGIDVYKKIRIDSYRRFIQGFKSLGVLGIGILFTYTLYQAYLLHWKVSLMFVLTLAIGLILRLKRKMFFTPVLVSMIVAIIVGII
jgi:mannose/fructose/N-acetylgalactosamine-specific phosphotransferase system component IID